MSKSGLYAHFGSKEELQLATIRAAQEVSDADVITPALEVGAGLARVEALCERCLSHVERGPPKRASRLWPQCGSVAAVQRLLHGVAVVGQTGTRRRSQPGPSVLNETLASGGTAGMQRRRCRCVPRRSSGRRAACLSAQGTDRPANAGLGAIRSSQAGGDHGHWNHKLRSAKINGHESPLCTERRDVAVDCHDR